MPAVSVEFSFDEITTRLSNWPSEELEFIFGSELANHLRFVPKIRKQVTEFIVCLMEGKSLGKAIGEAGIQPVQLSISDLEGFVKLLSSICVNVCELPVLSNPSADEIKMRQVFPLELPEELLAALTRGNPTLLEGYNRQQASEKLIQARIRAMKDIRELDPNVYYSLFDFFFITGSLYGEPSGVKKIIENFNAQLEELIDQFIDYKLSFTELLEQVLANFSVLVSDISDVLIRQATENGVTLKITKEEFTQFEPFANLRSELTDNILTDLKRAFAKLSQEK